MTSFPNDKLKILKNLLLKVKTKTRIITRIKLFFSKEIKEDIIKLETHFPQSNPHGFTNAEINYLFEAIPTLVSYRPHIMSRDGGSLSAPYIGSTKHDFIEDKQGYLEYYKSSIAPKNKDKIKYISPTCKLKANLAFTHFLDQTYYLCPLFTKFKILSLALRDS